MPNNRLLLLEIVEHGNWVTHIFKRTGLEYAATWTLREISRADPPGNKPAAFISHSLQCITYSLDQPHASDNCNMCVIILRRYPRATLRNTNSSVGISIPTATRGEYHLAIASTLKETSGSRVCRRRRRETYMSWRVQHYIRTELYVRILKAFIFIDRSMSSNILKSVESI